jgi:D-3-phosphoglycerate dehydrogenase
MKAGRWEKNKLQGRELAGKTLGVLGLGNIGRIVADRARGLRMNVIAYDPVLSPERAAQLGVELVSTDELFARADAITAHTPLTDETRGIVDDRAIGLMKKGVFLVNASRGGVYDEAALARGLESGKLGGVALDVFVTEPPPADHPLLKLDAVVATPHLGASTDEAQERVALEIVEQVIDYLAHGTITNAVNVPNVSRDAAPKLKPYLELARKLGSLVAQVEAIHPRAVEVECWGEPTELGGRAITFAAVAGILDRFFEGPVNGVSAPHVAKERGIAVRQLTSDGAAKYTHQIAVRIEGETGERFAAEGTLGVTGGSRLTRWGDCELDAELAGDALILFNADRPGVVGEIGSILGRCKVNIAQVHLGSNKRSGAVLSVWNVDSPIPPDALDQIRAAANVSRAVAVRLA